MNLPHECIKIHSPHPHFYDSEIDINPISYTKISVDHIDKHRLKINLPLSPEIKAKVSIKNDLERVTKTAEKMLDDYFKNSSNKKMFIYKPENGYFEKSSVNYDEYNKKWIIKNKNPEPSILFNDNKTEKSFIENMTYCVSTGNIEVNAETIYLKAKDYIDGHEIPNQYQREYLHWKHKIKNNLTIIIKSRATPIKNIPKNEQRAIETLREMITETEFRKYIIHGFVLVKGKSGHTYQIFRNKAHTKVWKNGQLIKEVCVRIQDSKIPPTDNIIVFKTLIEISEEDFEKLGNVYKMTKAA